MPGSKRQRTDLKTSIQQRQEQQRDRPTSTAKTSGGGLGGQQRQGMTVQFQPDPMACIAPTWDRSAPTPPPTWPGEPLSAPKVGALWHQPRPSAFEMSPPAPENTAHLGGWLPAPGLPEVRARLDARLAPLPRHGEPLSPAQEAALDLLDQFLSDCAREIRNPDSFDRLIDRTEYIGTQIGRAVANALREAQ